MDSDIIFAITCIHNSECLESIFTVKGLRNFDFIRIRTEIVFTIFDVVRDNFALPLICNFDSLILVRKLEGVNNFFLFTILIFSGIAFKYTVSCSIGILVIHEDSVSIVVLIREEVILLPREHQATTLFFITID